MTVVITDFNNMPANVRGLLDQSQSGFFGSSAWFDHFIATVASPSKWQCICAYDEQNPQNAVMPLILKTEDNTKVLSSMSNYYSPIYSIFSAQQQAPLAIDFFKQLKTLLPNWDLFELRPLSQEEQITLSANLNDSGLASLSFFCFGNWYLPVNQRSFAEYFESLSSQLKNTVSRKRKKFLKLPGARVEIVTNLNDLPQALEAYAKVYEASWKIPEPYPDFVPKLIQCCAELGYLRMGIAYLEDQPIAVQLWIVADGNAYIFKLAYDEAYKQYSAGTLLTTQLLEHVIDQDKVEVIDYLCGDDAYKKDWMSHRRERWGIWVFNTRTPRGLFEYVKEFSKFYIKKLLLKLGRSA